MGNEVNRINRSCGTCEFNSSGKCARHGNKYKYGEVIPEIKKYKKKHYISNNNKTAKK